LSFAGGNPRTARSDHKLKRRGGNAGGVARRGSPCARGPEKANAAFCKLTGGEKTHAHSKGPAENAYIRIRKVVEVSLWNETKSTGRRLGYRWSTPEKEVDEGNSSGDEGSFNNNSQENAATVPLRRRTEGECETFERRERDDDQVNHKDVG